MVGCGAPAGADCGYTYTHVDTFDLGERRMHVQATCPCRRWHTDMNANAPAIVSASSDISLVVVASHRIFTKGGLRWCGQFKALPRATLTLQVHIDVLQFTLKVI